MAVALVDLDRFKSVNDTLGHPAGDEVLVQVGLRLSAALRAQDTVARLGGDEFVLCLCDIGTVEAAEAIANKLLAALRSPLEIGGQAVSLGASLGFSFFPSDGEDVVTLLRNADAAMYRAKEEGRNTHRWYAREMTEQAHEAAFLQGALRPALLAGEFRLLYQPQVEMVSGRLVGVEALIRWHHPTRGLISPVDFIPVAEQCGMIWEIGEWVLRTACAQGRAWLDAGLAFGRVAVNIAGPQIRNPGFAALVGDVLRETGLPPANLELEVTEGFIMQKAGQGIDQLHLLRDQGVTLAIDDFGTGYSSLTYLKKLPVGTLKIDRSFVMDIPGDANDMAISEAIIALAKALSLDLVAEGVETEEQAPFLRGQGCEVAQGYLYSRPVEGEEVEGRYGRGQGDQPR